MAINNQKPIWSIGNLKALAEETQRNSSNVSTDIEYSKQFIDPQSAESRTAFILDYDAALANEDAKTAVLKGIKGNLLSGVGKASYIIGGIGALAALTIGASTFLPAAVAIGAGYLMKNKGDEMKHSAADTLMGTALTVNKLLKDAVNFREKLPGYRELKESYANSAPVTSRSATI